MVLPRILGAIFRYSVSKGKVLAAASEWVDVGRMYEYPETVSGKWILLEATQPLDLIGQICNPLEWWCWHCFC